MKYIIISFKNRNCLYTFLKILKNFNIFSSIINTPHSVSRSCGLSLKVDFSYYNTVINIINTSRVQDIIGVFAVERQGFNERISRLYWLCLKNLLK